MDEKTVDLFIELLQSLLRQTNEFAVKLAALENMLKRRPELHMEYKAEIRVLTDDPSNLTNLVGISELLRELRTRLLRG